MVNRIKSDFIQQSQLVQASVKDVLSELDRSPTTDEKFHTLTQKLDATLKILHTIKKQTSLPLFTQIATDTLEKEVVSLYGRVTDQWVKNKITRIKDSAAQIENGLSCGTLTARAVQKLAIHLRAFKKDHRPCIQDRRLIAQAALTVHKAQAFLQGKAEIKKTEGQQKIGYEDFITEEVETLLEIASYIHQKDMYNAKMRYYQLPENLKKRFLEHMVLLGATPFTDGLESKQAFIATANELVANGEGYLSRAQIDELFLGLSQVNLEENKVSDKIFSFKSSISLGG